MRVFVVSFCLIAIGLTSCTKVSGPTGNTKKQTGVIRADALTEINKQHRGRLKRANATVKTAAVKAKKDVLRPTYHFLPAANALSSPAGAVYYNGQYHMFFGQNPFSNTLGNTSWGHAVSKDLLRWQRLPIAVTPNSRSYDKDGLLSGCCVINDGVPTIIYTGIAPEAQCIARSFDDMGTWLKYERNPVVRTQPRKDLEGFRNPFAWKEGDTWYILVGSGISGQGGTALLYSSKTLTKWKYLWPLCVGFGRNWETPNFFPLGDKHVLVVSAKGGVRYSVGTYKGRKFSPGPWKMMDLGGEKNFYAANSISGKKGRRIIWGRISGRGERGYPWNGMLTLPRLLTLRKDGLLGIEPLPELKKLRKKHKRYKNVTIATAPSNKLNKIKGDALEIIAEFEPGDAKSFGIELLRSDDGAEKIVVRYDTATRRLACGDQGGDFELLADEETLKLHIFVDKSVVEVYANGRQCVTNRVYPQQREEEWDEPVERLGLKLFAAGGSAKVKTIDIWQMKSIW